MLALTLVALALAGCGGGDDATTAPADRAPAKPPEQQPTVPSNDAYIEQAEAICADMVAEAGRLGAALRKREEFPGDPLKLTTRHLIAPAIPVVAASAKRLRALEDESTDPDFAAYVGVYDPILALLRQRVEAGEGGERERAKDLEAQIVNLAVLQQRLALAAGLDDCDVDFVQAFATPGS